MSTQGEDKGKIEGHVRLLNKNLLLTFVKEKKKKTNLVPYNRLLDMNLNKMMNSRFYWNLNTASKTELSEPANLFNSV